MQIPFLILKQLSSLLDGVKSSEPKTTIGFTIDCTTLMKAKNKLTEATVIYNCTYNSIISVILLIMCKISFFE